MPIPFLAPDDEVTRFPAVEDALTQPNGLLMAGGSLSPKRLLNAYRNGIFPWYEEGEPILWWSPDPRCILWPAKMKISRSLRKSIRSNRFRIAEDTAFREVVSNCGKPRTGSTGTWVTQEMIDAYCRLANFGVARSVEVWSDDRLVGGLYGIALGEVFIGESMFSAERDASKIALAHLASCRRYKFIDCQMETPHLLSLGSETVSRREYILLLQRFGDIDKKLSGSQQSADTHPVDRTVGNPTDTRTANTINADDSGPSWGLKVIEGGQRARDGDSSA